MGSFRGHSSPCYPSQSLGSHFRRFYELFVTAVVWYCCHLCIRIIPGNDVRCLHREFGCDRGGILGTLC